MHVSFPTFTVQLGGLGILVNHPLYVPVPGPGGGEKGKKEKEKEKNWIYTI